MVAHLDDIIIFSKTELEHLKHIDFIFQKLVAAGPKLEESKCDFFKREIYYLGHLISDKGIHPLPEKLDTIRNKPRPKTPKEIKQFLGLYGYYRKFILIFQTFQDHWWSWEYMMQSSTGVQSVNYHLKCWKMHCAQLQSWNTLIHLNLTLFLQMLVNMDGPVYSPKDTHLL